MSIKYFTSNEEATEALSKHFKTLSLEKHPTAMIRLIIRRATETVLKNYRKEKISKNVEDKFRDHIISELRRYYGEWANIYDFSMKKMGFRSNFDFIFKTPWGRLYGSNPGSIHDHVFYTSHCFDQYQERSDCYELFPLLVLAYKRIRNTKPTPADILRFLLLFADEYCWNKNFIYVNTRNGVVVFEKLSGGIIIAKTFLLPDMDYPQTGWFKTTALGFNLDTTDLGKELCSKFPPMPINEPTFIAEEVPYNHYEKMMEQTRLGGLD